MTRLLEMGEPEMHLRRSDGEKKEEEAASEGEWQDDLAS